jgi:6-phosphogluconolactonase
VPQGRDIELVIADDPARVVAERLAEAANHGGAIVLTGGHTPKLAYEIAAELQPDWSRAELWWSDERCVPPEDPLSNFGMAKAALLDRVKGHPIVHRIPAEIGRDAAAEEYEAELGHAGFELTVLGMGSDAHVASLYPNEPTLEIDNHRVVGAEAKLEPFVDRVTLTVPALCEAREVLFLVEGEDKAEAVARSFMGEPTPEVPGSLVRSSGRTWAVLDAAAASRL